MAFDPTPIAVVTISGAFSLAAAYLAYRTGRKTKKKIEQLPADLVKDFARFQPGVDTVEKVVELLYTEINRLNGENSKLREQIEKLVAEKQGLLDEIRKMQIALEEQKAKLGQLESRIKNSIPGAES